MRLNELSIGEAMQLLLKSDEGVSFETQLEEGASVRLYRASSYNEVHLATGQLVRVVSGVNRFNEGLLDTFFSTGRPYVAWIGASLPKEKTTEQALIDIRIFAQEYVMSNNEKVLTEVSDDIFDLLTREFSRNISDREQLLKKLEQDITLNYDGNPYFVISSGRDSDISQLSGLRVYGKQYAIDIVRQGQSYRIRRIIRHPRPSRPLDVTLVKGQISFADVSVAETYQQEGFAELDRIVAQGEGSYLNLWNEYNNIERKNLNDRARELGYAEYYRYETLPEGWRLFVEKSADSSLMLRRLEIGDELEICVERPAILDHDYDEDADSIVFRPRPAVLGVQCEGVNIEQSIVYIRPLEADESKRPPVEGFLYASLTGDRIRLDRRKTAWDTIRSHQALIPGLGLLLERSLQFTARSYRAQKINLRDVRRAFGGDTPTSNQQAAVEIALHTPDIALIQGPPGTGKTRVIAAINQLISDNETVLLTSYQHDAVENVANRCDVFGLPVIKLGQRRRQDSELNQVEQWSLKQKSAIRSDQSFPLDLPAQAVLRRLKAHLLGYLKQPGSLQQITNMLDDIYGAVDGLIDQDLLDRLRALRRDILSPLQTAQVLENSHKNNLEQAIRALRVDQVSFADDGPFNAERLLDLLNGKDWLSDDEFAVLEKAANWLGDDPLDFLTSMEAIQEKLLDRLTSSKRSREWVNQVNTSVEQMLIKLIEAVDLVVRSSPGNIGVVVQRFLDDLEYDPKSVYGALQDYTNAIAATCQQSVGKDVQNYKATKDAQKEMDFDNVIIDEASRASPLDLLIPMAQAHRRIILVGDHRQLPQMLDPDVERELASASEETQDILAKSLFERLFYYLPMLEQQDGIRRVITLDTQYRMHPVLGDFVSNTFYARHNEAFHSGLAESSFDHGLERYAGRVAIWVDVPSNIDTEKSNGRSKYRTSEAEWVAAEAKRILDEQDHLTLGIITFYSAQVHQIMRALTKLEIVEQNENEDMQIATAYRLTHDGRERIRIGTVDAFQGKEFDVVILSMVRSNNASRSGTKYGFLTKENRLCVAMSRQKRLLLVVGDAKMTQHPTAREAVPGLVAFYELCGEGPYGCRLTANQYSNPVL